MSNIKENKYCEWRIVDIPHGMPIYNTGCGKIRFSCATGIDIYCNACYIHGMCTATSQKLIEYEYIYREGD